MKRAPHFADYPLAGKPVYLRWVIGLVAIVLGWAAFAEKLSTGTEPGLAIISIVAAVGLWTLVFLLRVLAYRFNRHNAQTYHEGADHQRRVWWRQHRQTVALVESVLVSAACSRPEQVGALLDPDFQPPAAADSSDGATIRLLQVFGDSVAERERELAVLLALQWEAQAETPRKLQPLRCYWQGSPAAWRAFAGQMTQRCPDVFLPDEPEPWQGIRSLDAIIDLLQSAPQGARVLCAGCHCIQAEQDSPLPAGEAAVLWLLGATGGATFSRGEWLAVHTEHIADVAQRALEQSELEAPAKACLSFTQPDQPDVSSIGWNTRQHLQDANFGALGPLAPMVLQTLAAWQAEQQGVPCAWLACDPYHTLTLGIVKPDDTTR